MLKPLRLAFYCDYPFGSARSVETLVKLINDRMMGLQERTEVSYIANGKLEGNSESIPYNHQRLIKIRPEIFSNRLILHRFKPIGFTMNSDLFQSYDLNLIFLDRFPTRKFLKHINSEGRKIVFLLHGMDVKRITYYPLRLPLFMFLFLAQARLSKKYLRSRNVFFQVLNEAQRNFLIDEILIPRSNVFLIPNGLKTDLYTTVDNRDDFNIVVLGRINKLPKGSNLLPGIIKEVLKESDERLTFCIIGKGEYLSSLIKKISDLGSEMRKRVSILGFISEVEKIKILSSGNLILSTSYTEPFPLSILEGLYSGLKVISTNTSGVTYMLSKGEDFGTWLRPSEKDFARAILSEFRKWKDDPASYFERKVKRAKLSKNLFNEIKMTNDYLEMINYILEKDL